jgi:hypothetical protein
MRLELEGHALAKLSLVPDPAGEMPRSAATAGAAAGSTALALCSTGWSALDIS